MEDKEHTTLFVLSLISSQIRACHVPYLPTRGNSLSRNQHWSHNGSFTKVYKRQFLLKKKERKKSLWENENISKAKLCWNYWTIDLKFSFIYPLLSKVILYLNFIVYIHLLSVIEYLYSFKLLFMKTKSDLVLNNTWVS